MDFVVVNGENAAGGHGLTPATARELRQAGADVITSGNHIWDRPEIRGYLEDHPRVLRPENYPATEPGRGLYVGSHDDVPVAVINLQGLVFMETLGDPFRTADRLLEELSDQARIVLVDFHAEATSEKIAMGWFLDGRVSAVLGTHTHVATADARVLPRGTACMTDVGMTGAHDSILGVEKSEVLDRFLTRRRIPFTPAERDVRLCGALIDVSPTDGRAASIRRIELGEEELGGSP